MCHCEEREARRSKLMISLILLRPKEVLAVTFAEFGFAEPRNLVKPAWLSG
jgi:hypothetical protein